MIRTDKKEQCSGCGACALVCPQKCIRYATDALGSPYATKADGASCVDCGACETVCPMQRSFEEKTIGQSAYAAFSKDDAVRYRGSSGGLFETAAAWILSKNGRVFASGFDDHLKLRMTEASAPKEVRRLTKSKYLQSDVSACFPIIRERIRQGIYVLVCATPCQIAALKRYLGHAAEADNFFCMDFFCHGVPSQQLFDRCIAYIETRDRMKVTGYAFRSKIKNGATPHYYTLSFVKNGRRSEKTRLYFHDPFYLGFQKYITLRDSCYHCPYGYGNHAADLTVGDFHDIDKYIRGVNRFDGVSTVIVNNEYGARLWREIRDTLVVYEMPIERLYADGQIYAGGTAEPKGRADFVRDMENEPFEKTADKWLNSKREWKKNVYYRLPAFVRERVKALMKL